MMSSGSRPDVKRRVNRRSHFGFVASQDTHATGRGMKYRAMFHEMLYHDADGVTSPYFSIDRGGPSGAAMLSG